MNKDVKDTVQVCSALGMLIAGTGLAVAGFIVKPTGEIHDSVLWLFAQCLVYAGSIFGVAIYIASKFRSLENKFKSDKEKEDKKDE